MVFLFESGITRHIPVSVYVDLDGTDDALLNQDIWNSLGKSNGDRLAVSVAPSYPLQNVDNKGKQSTSPWLKSLTCWTRPSANLSGLGIPSEWLDKYPALFENASSDPGNIQSDAPSTHTIVPVQPVLLSEIILIAESQSSYDVSLNHQGKLTESLCGGSRLFRQGSIVTLTLEEAVLQANGRKEHEAITRPQGPNNRVHQFRVLMAEPTLQGFARQDFTRFIVLPSSAEDSPAPSFMNGDISPQESETSSEAPSESDAESLEIDENFLASGIIRSVSNANLVTLNGKLDTISNFNNGPHSPASPDPRRLISGSHSLIFQAEPLAFPVRHPPHEILDAESCIFLRTADLSRIGMFNGDWVRLHGHKPFMRRQFSVIFNSYREY